MAAGGPSSVVLLELPEFESPYTLAIESFNQRSKGMFIPSGVYFDVDFNSRGDFGEDQLTGRNSVLANLAVTEAIKDVRHILLFTRGDLAGLSVMRRGSNINEPIVWVERSLEGRIEVEAKTGR
jgi:hypothetical protein